jgi:hypothetical protein
MPFPRPTALTEILPKPPRLFQLGGGKRKEKAVKDLMLARRAKDHSGVDKAKRALGERGPTWWKGEDYNRYLAKNTPYANWYAKLK